MNKQDQQAMDGSAARVTRTLVDLIDTGTFASYDHRHDPGGNPVYINIKFQCGPIREIGINGCSIEDVIDVLIARLDGFQRGPFVCPENDGAIAYLKGAKRLLLERTAARQAQGVEGTSAPHVS